MTSTSPDAVPQGNPGSEALLREAGEADPQRIGAHLSACGFSGVPQNWPFVLAAMTMRGELGGELARNLGITEDEAGQMTDTLVLGGYLERRVAPNGRSITLATERGQAMLTTAWNGVVGPARWASFPFRQGDIVVATPAKSGTTWLLMICALLVFQTPDLPEPLSRLSGWLDYPLYPRDQMFARLAGHNHRRFIKTHTPLNAMPIDGRATYVVIGRHPLDVRLSLYHHNVNMSVNHIRVPEGGRGPLPGREHGPEGGRGPLPGREHGPVGGRGPLPGRDGRPEADAPLMTEREDLVQWIDDTPPPGDDNEQFALPQVMCHFSDAWERRGEPNVVLVHYEDLSADLEGEMRRLAAHLGISVPDATWPSLVRAASFEQMRAVADRLKPFPGLNSNGNTAFFRKGASGAGRGLLTPAELAHYNERVARLAPPDLLAWLHRDAPRSL
jgi:aryl sulfotransferase